MNHIEQLEVDFDTELTAGNLKNGMKDAGASSGDLWKVPVENLRIMASTSASTTTSTKSRSRH